MSQLTTQPVYNPAPIAPLAPGAMNALIMPVGPPPPFVPLPPPKTTAGMPVRQVSPLEQVRDLCRGTLARNPRFEIDLLMCLRANPALIDQARAHIQPAHFFFDMWKFAFEMMCAVADFARNPAESPPWPMEFTVATISMAIARTRSGDRCKSDGKKTSWHNLFDRPLQWTPQEAAQMLSGAIGGMKDFWIRRQAVDHAAGIIEAASHPEITGAKLFERCQNHINSLRPYIHTAEQSTHFGDCHAKETLAAAAGGWVPSFLPAIGHCTLGFRPGTLTVFGAFLGAGKSMMLLNVALDAALKSGIPTIYMDTEMQKGEQYNRLLSSITGLTLGELALGSQQNDPVIVAKIDAAEAALKTSPFHHRHVKINDPPEAHIAEMQMFSRNNPGRCLIVFDYLKVGDAANSNSSPEWARLGDLVYKFKQAALQLDVPIVTACQLNRQAESKGQHEFVTEGLSYIGGSIKIAQEADNVIALRTLIPTEETRVEKLGLRSVDSDEPALNRLRFNLVAHIMKARGGTQLPSGVPLYFKFGVAKFTEMYHEFTDEAAGVRATDDRGRFIASPERELLHKHMSTSVAKIKPAKATFPNAVQAALPPVMAPQTQPPL